MKNKLFIGVDIGGTKIAAGLIKSSGKILARAKLPTPFKASASTVLSVIEGLVSELLDGEGLKKKDLEGIGIAVPGIVRDNGMVVVTPNINLTGFNIVKALRSKFRIKAACGNDVNLGVLAESWLGAVAGSKNVVGLFPGTGVGGGVIVGGELLCGSGAGAGELGHMIIDVNGPSCGCGNKGCLEAVVGRRAIERDIRKAVAAGRKSIITKLAGADLSVIKSRVLAQALDSGDRLTQEVMRRMSFMLGLACVSLRHIFDPEFIVLGGGVIEACGDFILPIVKKAVEQDKFFLRVSKCKVVRSELGDEAVMLGAAALLIHK